MILFVDDEPRRVENYVEVLEASGYDVTYHKKVDDALTFFYQNSSNIELLVLDIMMPIGDSFEQEESQEGLITGVIFLGRVRSIMPTMPVIALTNLDIEDLPSDLENDEHLLVLNKLEVMSTAFAEDVKGMIEQKVKHQD